MTYEKRGAQPGNFVSHRRRTIPWDAAQSQRLCAALRRWMYTRGETPTTMAAKMPGVTRGAIEHARRGVAPQISISVAHGLAALMGVSVEEIAGPPGHRQQSEAEYLDSVRRCPWEGK